MTTPIRYTGKQLTKPRLLLRNGIPQRLQPYIPSPELVKAVNLAMLLERPLLVMGEPGCGKSLLAKSVAYELYGENMFSHYQEWPVKSTSRARDGLYEFDQVHRLRDATVGDADIRDVQRYIHLGPLGRAFEHSTAPDKRTVLLIDEIDKADIDFPNDLLNELERMEFDIPEMKLDTAQDKDSTIRAQARPIVIITSNSEKELPDAFLRRCLFHYIQPPGEAVLRDIVTARYYDEPEADLKLVDDALTVFVALRKSIQEKVLTLGKNISTSEFLDWFEALKYFSEQEENPAPFLQPFIAEVEQLNTQGLRKIPFPQILFKNLQTVLFFDESNYQS